MLSISFLGHVPQGLFSRAHWLTLAPFLLPFDRLLARCWSFGVPFLILFFFWDIGSHLETTILPTCTSMPLPETQAS